MEPLTQKSTHNQTLGKVGLGNSAHLCGWGAQNRAPLLNLWPANIRTAHLFPNSVHARKKNQKVLGCTLGMTHRPTAFFCITKWSCSSLALAADSVSCSVVSHTCTENSMKEVKNDPCRANCVCICASLLLAETPPACSRLVHLSFRR